MWSSCPGSTLKFCNLAALHEPDEKDSASFRPDRLMCLEKLGQDQFLIRVVGARSAVKQERTTMCGMKKGNKEVALDHALRWMKRYGATTYVEWTPKLLMLSAISDYLSGSETTANPSRRLKKPQTSADTCSSATVTDNDSEITPHSVHDGSFEATVSDLLTPVANDSPNLHPIAHPPGIYI